MGGQVDCGRCFLQRKRLRLQAASWARSRRAGADGIFIPGYYNEVGTIARQAKNDIGLNIPLMGGDGWDSEKLVEGAGGPGGALEGAYFSTHYSKDDKSTKVQEFVKAFSAKSGKAPRRSWPRGTTR